MWLQMLYPGIICLCFHAGSSSGLSADCSSSSTGIPVIARHYMDMQELDQAAQRYFAAGLASATHKTYQSAKRREFCGSFSLVPLPTSEPILYYFAAYLDQQGLAHTSIRTYLLGVRQL